MRPKYDTRGIVLARAPSGEANASVTILTEDLGLIQARATGVRRPGAKLASALATFAESDLVLVKGKDSWRVAGAVLAHNWFEAMSPPARSRAVRVVGFVLRLSPHETPETDLFPVLRVFFETLSNESEDAHDAAEILVALQLLAALGLDAGSLPDGARSFSRAALDAIAADRRGYVARINRGIEASGL